MSAIKIETGTVTPVVRRGRPRKYPFADMQVGQFFVAGSESEPVLYQTLHSCLKHWKVERCRKVKDKDCPEFRITCEGEGDTSKPGIFRVTRVR